MKNIETVKVENLSEKELMLVNGGRLLGPSFWWGYVVSEVLEGIQRGLSADCSEACAQ